MSAFQAAVDRLQARRGQPLRSWGPVTLDAVTLARFHEALGWPNPAAAGSVPPAVLLQLGNIEIDVTRDARPHEDLDPGLTNALNGGTALHWYRALLPGEAISGRSAIKDAFLREGKSGTSAVVLQETVFLDGAGEPVARAEKTTIFRGAVA